jgi:hypothetical protein
VEAYRKFTETYARLWTNVDPVFGSITRKAAVKGRERVAMELHISPYAKSKYGLLENFFGQASPWRLSDIKGNLLSAEVIVKEPPREAATVTKTSGEPNRLFGGLQDCLVPTRIRQGDVVLDRSWQRIIETSVRGYIGQYKPVKGGLMDSLFRKIGGSSDAQGYSKQSESIGPADGLWTRHFGDFLVIGIDRKTLEAATPQMKLQKAERAAQVRYVLGDLEGSRIESFLAAHLYTRDRKISAANAMLQQTLIQQLHVAPKEALLIAEHLLDQRLTCPLGGQYVLTPANRWISTAWQEERLRLVDRVPAGYHPPALNWLHGTALEFTIDPQSLQTRIELWVDPSKIPVPAWQD